MGASQSIGNIALDETPEWIITWIGDADPEAARKGMLTALRSWGDTVDYGLLAEAIDSYLSHFETDDGPFGLITYHPQSPTEMFQIGGTVNILDVPEGFTASDYVSLKRVRDDSVQLLDEDVQETMLGDATVVRVASLEDYSDPAGFGISRQEIVMYGVFPPTVNQMVEFSFLDPTTGFPHGLAAATEALVSSLRIDYAE